MDVKSNHFILEASSELPTARQLKKLLFQGALINYQRFDDGYSALMLAAKKQRDRIAEYLLKQGANPLLLNHQNRIASELIPRYSSTYPILKDSELLFATMNNDFLAVKLIIDTGAHIDFQGPGGYTALMIASEQNLLKIFEYLFEKGANPWLTRSDGKSAFDLATDSVSNYFHRYVNNQNKIITERMQITLKQKSPSFFSNFGNETKFNVSKDAIFLKSKSNRTKPKIKECHIEISAINYQSEDDGYTPLMLAVDIDDQALVTFLLQHGANPKIKNHYNEIASDIALCYSPIYQILKNEELYTRPHEAYPEQETKDLQQETLDTIKYRYALNELLEKLYATAI